MENEGAGRESGEGVGRWSRGSKRRGEEVERKGERKGRVRRGRGKGRGREA